MIVYLTSINIQSYIVRNETIISRCFIKHSFRKFAIFLIVL